MDIFRYNSPNVKGTSFSLLYKNRVTEIFYKNIAFKQGNILSTFIFSLFINHLLSVLADTYDGNNWKLKLGDLNILSLLFADNLAFFHFYKTNYRTKLIF